MRLHSCELSANARGKVGRTIFSTVHIPSIPRTSRPLYRLSARESSYVTAGLTEFNEWGPFLAYGVVPGPLSSTDKVLPRNAHA
jgi:hypothetical protein